MKYEVMNNIIAGIVCYNPEIFKLEKNILSIINQVRYVIIVDNCSRNIEEIEKLAIKYERIFLYRNEKNFGIAKALNQIIEFVSNLKSKWVLLLDQDSICIPNLIVRYQKYINMQNVGIITSYVVDQNTGKIFEIDEKKLENSEYSIITKCITSGSLMDVNKCIECGWFDEKMFIDYVDYDMCFSMQEHGYKIIRCKFEGLLHELGNSKEKHVFNKVFFATNHSPLRRYYFSRNIIYCIKKHRKSINSFKYLYKVLIRIVIVFIYEDQKYLKLKMAFKGIIDGIFMPVEKCKK